MGTELLQTQANLIECLKFLKVNHETIKAIMLMIPQDNQISKMASWLLENPRATEQEILKQAVVISE